MLGVRTSTYGSGVGDTLQDNPTIQYGKIEESQGRRALAAEDPSKGQWSFP